MHFWVLHYCPSFCADAKEGDGRMLRYTARWFLSRTIRTVLSKYLLDIDVDSVYIPYGEAAPNEGGGRSASSSHADDDGPDSGGGWGIHLSNVRLREGVTL